MGAKSNKFELIYDKSLKAFIINYRGAVGVETLLQMILAVTNHSEFRPAIKLVHNFLQASLDIVPSEMNLVKQDIVDKIYSDSQIKTAIVSQEKIDQVLAEIYRTSGDPAHYEEMEIFSTMQDALEWLRNN